MPNDDQDRRVVLVTGAGSGIGRVAAREFAANRDRVLATGIEEAGVQETADGHDGVEPVVLDVCDPEGIRAVVDDVRQRYGRLDVLINNAMICSDDDFATRPNDDVMAELDVNLGGAIRMTQAVLPGMREQGSGVIINVSSVNGVQYFGNEVYSAAKAGLINLTRSIAVQQGKHGIRCNAVAPGTIATEHWEPRVEADPEVFDRLARWYPLGRVGQPTDVTAALMFLASDAASWITGVTLPVDGGLLAGNLPMTQEILADPQGESL